MSNGNRTARRAWASALKKHVKRGKVYITEYQHDDWCAIYTAARLCNCNPDRVLKDHKGQTLAAVAGAGFYDPLELMGAAQ